MSKLEGARTIVEIFQMLQGMYFEYKSRKADERIAILEEKVKNLEGKETNNESVS